MWYWNGMGGWWTVLGIIGTGLFWAGIIVLIVWAVRRMSERPGSTTGAGKTPLDIARERYARGEITKEQFEQLKKDLS